MAKVIVLDAALYKTAAFHAATKGKITTRFFPAGHVAPVVEFKPVHKVAS
jgi:hypothetical protein